MPEPYENLLRDRYGRVASDLRLSVTDVCNLRCTYCLPAEGVSWLPRAGVLTAEELVRLALVGVERLGIRKVRLTGGEPLLRPDLEAIVGGIRARSGVELALTTNGIGLDERARALKVAGLNRVNISLDTLDPAVHERLSRRRGHERVLAGIEAARSEGLSPRLNSVLLRGVNEHETVGLVEFAVERGLELRFIEQMPIGASRAWAAANVVTAEDTLDRLRTRFEVLPVAGRGPQPAERFRLRRDGHDVGHVGIIASVTRPFCSACDRTRISADGQLRSCLFSQTETDLRGPMRAGADDAELARVWTGGMAAKPRAHGKDDAGFDDGYVQPERGMHAIGG